MVSTLYYVKEPLYSSVLCKQEEDVNFDIAKAFSIEISKASKATRVVHEY